MIRRIFRLPGGSDLEDAEIDVRIRRVETEDGPQVRQVLTAAFDGEEEANLVASLTAENAIEFGLVAEAAGHHIGNIFFSRLTITGPADPVRALALAPVAIHPDLQRLGIGSALINGGLALAAQNKWDMVLVLGDPEFYHRFGFEVDAAKAVDCPYSGPALAAWTYPGVILPDNMIARYPDSFNSLN
ncbi:GNAT family N-acetyltransferase [Alphaproteobacteria bacterium HT1-32]|nr:GNAT family N-acetyltransferase [Alphaproteobacteria bacterium HT1-32]